jgi:hypothetical protein
MTVRSRDSKSTLCAGHTLEEKRAKVGIILVTSKCIYVTKALNSMQFCIEFDAVVT